MMTTRKIHVVSNLKIPSPVMGKPTVPKCCSCSTDALSFLLFCKGWFINNFKIFKFFKWLKRQKLFSISCKKMPGATRCTKPRDQHTLWKNPGFHSLIISLDCFTLHAKLEILLSNISVSLGKLVTYMYHRLYEVPLLSLLCIYKAQKKTERNKMAVWNCPFLAFRIFLHKVLLCHTQWTNFVKEGLLIESRYIKTKSSSWQLCLLSDWQLQGIHGDDKIWSVRILTLLPGLNWNQQYSAKSGDIHCSPVVCVCHWSSLPAQPVTSPREANQRAQYYPSKFFLREWNWI